MADNTHIRLSELTANLSNVIDTAFKNQYYWVIAEVTNYNPYPQKGHHYFDLVEKSGNGVQIIAKMQGVAWSQGNTSIKEFERVTGQKFTNDIQVLAKVMIEYHATFGLKLVLVDVDINFTIGALEKQKQDTLRKLLTEHAGFIRKEGERYITRNAELPFSLVIQNIAVVTSSSSAGLHDFMHTLESNSFHYHIEVDTYFTVVQGEAKAEVFYNKLLEVFNSGKKYDAVIIIRGGGAQTDFLIFDQYMLGLIVAKFPVPIITGIGHHKNETIVDMMAHTATKTPTKAAEFIIAHNRAFEEKVLLAQKTIIIKSQQIFTRHAANLNSLNGVIVNNSHTMLTRFKDNLVNKQQIVINRSKEIVFAKKGSLVSISSQLSSKPKILVSTRLNDLSNILNNIKTFNNQYLKNQLGYLNHFRSIAKTMAPDNILKKGFAIVKIKDNITSDPDKIKVGQEMTVILSNIQITSTVKNKTSYDGSDFNV